MAISLHLIHCVKGGQVGGQDGGASPKASFGTCETAFHIETSRLHLSTLVLYPLHLDLFVSLMDRYDIPMPTGFPIDRWHEGFGQQRPEDAYDDDSEVFQVGNVEGSALHDVLDLEDLKSYAAEKRDKRQG